MPEATDRFAAAIAAIDDANAADPVTILVDGELRPKELVHAERVTAWVRRLDPEAGEPQLLAARAHHLQRWASPRSSYPEGRGGYLRWRTDAKKRHANEVAEILIAAGYDDETAARVGAIIRKEGLGRDAQVQVHEDALCLVFLELQLDELGADLGVERSVAVLAKTLPKMSDAAKEAAAQLPLSDGGRRLLALAIEAAPGH